ncbi:MAG: flippase [Campylobacterota bacterium]
MIAKLKSLKNHQGFMKYFKNSNWLFLERFFKLFVSFLVGIYVARYLGPENFGLLNYAIVLTGFAVPFFRLGLHPVLNKKFIEKDESDDKLFGTSLVAQMVMFLVISLLFIYFLWTSSISNEEKIIIGIILIGKFFLIFEIYDQYFNAKVQSKYISYASIASTIVSAILKVGLVLYSADLLYFAIVILIELFIKAILLQYYIFKNQEINIQKWKFDKTLLKKLLHESWPFILTGTMTGLYMKIDQVMIKHMIDNEAVGYYSVAVKLSELWSIIPIIIVQSLFPAIINAYNRNKVLFELRMRRLYLFNFATSILLITLLVIFSDQLVLFLFGNEFLQSSNVLSLYAWAMLFIFLGLATEKWMFANNLQKISLYSKTLAVIVNIVLNYILLQNIGLEGAAIATIVSYGCSVILFPIIWKAPRKNIKLLLTCWKIK